MDKLYNTINELTQITMLSSTKMKTEYIKGKYEEDPYSEFMQVLKFLLNTSDTTGISYKRLKTEVDSGEEVPDGDSVVENISLIDLICKLTENNTGTNLMLKLAVAYVRHNSQHKEMLMKILSKELKLGITAKSVNKVIPNFAYTIEFMKAKNYMDRYEKGRFDFKQNYIISEKLDGIRCAVIKKNSSDIKAFSRQGKGISGLVEIIDAFKSESFPKGVYDGELLSMGEFETDEQKFQHTCSVVNSKSDNKVDIEFIVFDSISVSEFLEGYSNTPYGERFEYIDTVISNYKREIGENKQVVTSTSAKKYFHWGEVTHDYLMNLVETCDREGKEGVMINDVYAPYKAGRVDGILKLKKNLVADVRIVGFTAGEGKHEGSLGALVVEFDYKGIKNTCSIGTGFSDEERRMFWEKQDAFLGEIIEVKYQKITKNKDDNCYSLGFASYNHRLRNDKTETNV